MVKAAARRFSVGPEGLPDLPGMMLATVDALKQMGGSGSIHELDEKVAEIEGLSEDEQSYPMGNDDPRTRVKYYLAWARTYLRRGDALKNSARGIWALTELGEQLTNLGQAQSIYRRVNDEERARARQKRLEKRKENQPEIEQDSDIDASEETPDTDWKSQLLSVLQTVKPDEFERLSQRLLREAGFVKVEVRGKSGDGGIDGVGVLRVNLVSFARDGRVASGQRRFATFVEQCRAELIKDCSSPPALSQAKHRTKLPETEQLLSI